MSFDDDLAQFTTTDDGTRPPNLEFVREKLVLGILSMATDTRGLRERLHGAWMHIHVLKADDFPASLRNKFVHIADAVPKNEPYLTALTRLDDDKVHEIIESVVLLYDGVCRQCQPPPTSPQM